MPNFLFEKLLQIHSKVITFKIDYEFQLQQMLSFFKVQGVIFTHSEGLTKSLVYSGQNFLGNGLDRLQTFGWAKNVQKGILLHSKMSESCN